MSFHHLKSKKVYGLVDCDGFFASCEILRNPKIQNKAVCVGTDIVIASNYIAKSYGIKTGTPVWDAKKILGNNGIYINPDISFYGRISNKIMNFLTKFANEIEIFSIDEAFIDITGLDKIYGISYYELALNLKKEILKQIGVPVSIGISYTKLIAKIFAPIHKPFGTYVQLNPNDIDEIFKEIPIQKIPFIGKASAIKLENIASNIYEFKTMDYINVKRLLQGAGIKIWLELNGINIIKYGNNAFPKGITRTRSFNPDFTKDKDHLYSRLILNFERAFEELTKYGMEFKYIKIFLRKKDFGKYNGDVILPQHTNHRPIILNNIRQIYNTIFQANTRYRGTGVIFGNLREVQINQTSLFDFIENKSNKNNLKVWKIINQINYKFGRFVVSSANSFDKSKNNKKLFGIGLMETN